MHEPLAGPPKARSTIDRILQLRRDQALYQRISSDRALRESARHHAQLQADRIEQRIRDLAHG